MFGGPQNLLVFIDNINFSQRLISQKKKSYLYVQLLATSGSWNSFIIMKVNIFFEILHLCSH